MVLPAADVPGELDSSGSSFEEVASDCITVMLSAFHAV